MKIKNRKKVIVLCAAFVAAGVGMNVQNAIAYYGMASPKGSLLAQSITGYTDSNFFSNASSIGCSIGSYVSSLVSSISSYINKKEYKCAPFNCTITDGISWGSSGEGFSSGGYHEVSYNATCYDCISGKDFVHCSDCPKPKKKYN